MRSCHWKLTVMIAINVWAEAPKVDGTQPAPAGRFGQAEGSRQWSQCKVNPLLSPVIDPSTNTSFFYSSLIRYCKTTKDHLVRYDLTPVACLKFQPYWHVFSATDSFCLGPCDQGWRPLRSSSPGMQLCDYVNSKCFAILPAIMVRWKPAGRHLSSALGEPFFLGVLSDHSFCWARPVEFIYHLNFPSDTYTQFTLPTSVLVLWMISLYTPEARIRFFLSMIFSLS